MGYGIILQKSLLIMEGKQMKISSYNCRGFKGNCKYIKEVYNKCDILLLQETWLYNFELNQFNKDMLKCQYQYSHLKWSHPYLCLNILKNRLKA